MSEAASMQSCHVLVIEDEPSIADTIEYALKSEGFTVSLAGTGQDGLAVFRGNSVDFIVLDVGLPDQSGFDVCREIRKTGSTPVMFLTARESEIDRVVGLEIGADDYMVKPFSPRELVARVRAIRRRFDISSPRETSAHLAAGMIQMDLERRRVIVADQEIELSRYEFGLLQVFVEHPGRVYTRDQLMDLVWDEPEASSDRTVDAHIKGLRAKLRTASKDAEDAITTHRGVGYALREGLR